MTQHYISVAAVFDDEGDLHVPFEYVWEKFNGLAEQLGGRNEIKNVSVTAVHAGELSENEEYFDEYTVMKAREAVEGVLRKFEFESATSPEVTDRIINRMLSAGILFRERGPRT